MSPCLSPRALLVPVGAHPCNEQVYFEPIKTTKVSIQICAIILGSLGKNERELFKKKRPWLTLRFVNASFHASEAPIPDDQAELETSFETTHSSRPRGILQKSNESPQDALCWTAAWWLQPPKPATSRLISKIDSSQWHLLGFCISSSPVEHFELTKHVETVGRPSDGRTCYTLHATTTHQT